MTVKNSLRYLLAFSIFFGVASCNNLDDTEDIASLLVGTYKGDAQNDFADEKNVKVIITRISNDTIEIAPAELNFTNTTIRLKVTINDNVVKHHSSESGITFEAEPKKRKIPMNFSVNSPIQTFEGKLN